AGGGGGRGGGGGTLGGGGGEGGAAAGGGPRLADGEGKAIVEAKCMSCHDAQRIVRSRGTPARWREVVHSMQLYAQGSTLAKPLTNDEERVLLAYLAAHYGPDPGSARPRPDPFSRLPRTLLPPEARGYIVVEYELPNPRAQPHEVAVDLEGNGWVPQRVGGRLGRFDFKPLTYPEYEPPAATSTVVRLNGIRRGNEGEFWMVDGGPNRRWLSFSPKAERFTVYNLPPTRSGNASGNTVRVLPDGTVWLAAIASDQVVRLRPATEPFTFLAGPAGGKRNKTANPYGLAGGGGGNSLGGGNSGYQNRPLDRGSG